MTGAGYPAQVRAAERAAVRKRRRGSFGRNILAIRIGDLDRFLVDFYGPFLPDDDAGLEDATLMGHHLAHLADPEFRMRDWFDRRCPWMGILQRDILIAKILEKPLRYRAATLGGRLRLTNADRERLRITTIRPADITIEALQTLRRTRKREKAEETRRAGGRRAMAEIKATSLAARRPWEQMNVSRRTWYRMRAVARGTEV